MVIDDCGGADARCVVSRLTFIFRPRRRKKAADRIIDEVWGEQSGQNRNQDSKPAGAGATQGHAPAPLRTLMLAGSQRGDPDSVGTGEPGYIHACGQCVAVCNGCATRFAGGVLRFRCDRRNRRRVDRAARRQCAGAAGSPEGPIIWLRPRIADRNNLYQAIAQANGHPEWEPNIRADVRAALD